MMLIPTAILTTNGRAVRELAWGWSDVWAASSRSAVLTPLPATPCRFVSTRIVWSAAEPASWCRRGLVAVHHHGTAPGRASAEAPEHHLRGGPGSAGEQQRHARGGRR